MVSFPTLNMSNLCRRTTLFQPLNCATRIFADTAFYSGLLVASLAAATKYYLDPMSERRDECLNHTLQTLNTTNTETKESYMWFWKTGVNKDLSQQERLDATQKMLASYLRPEDGKALKNPMLARVLKQVEAAISQISKASPSLAEDKQDALISQITGSLTTLQKDTKKRQNTTLLCAAALAALGLTLKLGISQAALRGLRVIS